MNKKNVALLNINAIITQIIVVGASQSGRKTIIRDLREIIRFRTSFMPVVLKKTSTIQPKYSGAPLKSIFKLYPKKNFTAINI
ncbi:hypothetical protein SAMN04515674_102550 [Pseudarcicella hirudinis]|uniref:Uncharacterized protein n=1 Tax=Pseudarcicella hirudinis TaxID=1079859 RepID=A0A1I5PNU4_9BACT|nr:hypothetical protein [Pseudarcicella hirudinis]SFP35460.1 hypothetical protein SAMN04515674_102550 [Pseudarcicella hirudinis]